ncbi:hypothetical protein DMC30DRAFT_415659 [Rhodotorula diobovata]|uniref:Uncharacterized protein n=1 Tax=Rhodotorula diobovata TaxID=5288 RepID=A0A5C5FYC7_9BASI|nr:hypothetical protein DMC30DRAFT_415659 [Rhodotorula diobovata]
MTSVDPSHIPGLHKTRDNKTGQAVYDSVSPLHSLSNHLAHQDRSTHRRRPSPPPRHSAPDSDDSDHSDDDDDDDDDDDTLRDKVPIPPIPDLRFEQGVLASIRPFLHRADLAAASSSSPSSSDDKQKKGKLYAAEKGALASANLTAEGGRGGPEGESPSDVLMAPLRIEWTKVTYVLLRDQVVFPLLQGILWGCAGFYLSQAWSWNKARLAAKAEGKPRPSLLRSVGIHTR